ncbi:MAG: 2-dehydro-3-deoxyglucarate aldolase, partial [Planctomycetales bacterium]|nr:2-dehydro-3-deoxyglucarate aldolase [Planctomycetales bacterium]
GTWLTTGNLQMTRSLARTGFDWLTLDLEHTPFDWREISALLACISDAGCAPLVRVPEGTHTWIKRSLDAGAYGIVVPMVETVEQAKLAIAAAKYPPVGNRSIGGGMHSLNFDASNEEYYQSANHEIMVVLQTESPLGIENSADIYALPGCDAVFVGPNDLRYHMRDAAGNFPSDDEFEKAIQRIIDTGRNVGTPTGMHVSGSTDAIQRISQGMQFVAISSDLRMVLDQASLIVGALGLAPSKSKS